MKVNTAQFMALYAWYSWPNVVLCFFGGFLIDRVFGIRWVQCLCRSCARNDELKVQVKFKLYIIKFFHVSMNLSDIFSPRNLGFFNNIDELPLLYSLNKFALRTSPCTTCFLWELLSCTIYYRDLLFHIHLPLFPCCRSNTAFFRGKKEILVMHEVIWFSFLSRLGTIIFSIFVCVGQVSAGEGVKDDEFVFHSRQLRTGVGGPWVVLESLGKGNLGMWVKSREGTTCLMWNWLRRTVLGGPAWMWWTAEGAKTKKQSRNWMWSISGKGVASLFLFSHSSGLFHAWNAQLPFSFNALCRWFLLWEHCLTLSGWWKWADSYLGESGRADFCSLR